MTVVVAVPGPPLVRTSAVSKTCNPQMVETMTAKKMIRRSKGQRQIAKSGEGRSAVEFRRLIELARQADDRGDEEHRPIADVAPDIEDGEHGQRMIGAQPGHPGIRRTL